MELFREDKTSIVEHGSHFSLRVSNIKSQASCATQNILPVQINEQYAIAISKIHEGSRVIFVTGKAGTGKSTFIRFLREKLDPDIPVIAPTGVAAINVHGQTIHSFFQFPPRIVDSEQIKILRNYHLFENLKILIIDEISMVRADLMDAIDLSLKKNTGKTDLPFGGVQIILIGDLLQLPPVIASNAEAKYLFSRYKTPYFLSADCLQSTPPHVIELTKVYRQKDEKFIQLLSSIRIGESLQSAISYINKYCYHENNCDKPDAAITLTPDNASSDRINNRKLSELKSELREYEGIIKGRFNIEENRLPSPKLLKLKTGAHVMFTKNDQDHRWVNGTTGIISKLTDIVITIETTEGSLNVCREIWETIRYKYDELSGKIVAETIGTYTQFPLMLSWAITIHKSQGKTLDNVLIDLGYGAFANGQVYVALSRCRSLEGISLKRPIKQSDIKVDSIIKDFYSRI